MLKQRQIIPLGIALMAAAASVLATASLAAANPFVSFDTRWCLQPVNESTVQGAPIVLELCDRGAAQEWTRFPSNGKVVQYRNRLSGMCLDARGGARNGTPVQQWTCNRISNEKWEPGEEEFGDIPPPVYSRVSGTHSHCLDIPGGQPIAGLAMQIYRCNGTDAQLWYYP